MTADWGLLARDLNAKGSAAGRLCFGGVRSLGLRGQRAQHWISPRMKRAAVRAGATRGMHNDVDFRAQESPPSRLQPPLGARARARGNAGGSAVRGPAAHCRRRRAVAGALAGAAALRWRRKSKGSQARIGSQGPAARTGRRCALALTRQRTPATAAALAWRRTDTTA